MFDLNEFVDSNYLEHPAFRFEDSSWNLPIERLNSFNEVYELICQIGGRVNATSCIALYEEALGALNDIFNSLEVQAIDQYEQYFVNELRAACIRIMKEEFDWYSKPEKAGIADMHKSQMSRNVVSLLKERHFFGVLPHSSVMELKELAGKELVRFHANAADGKLTRDDLSVNCGQTVRKIREVLNREFQALGVLDALSAYIGRPVKVFGLALELSVPSSVWWRNAVPGLERPPNTLYAHLDEGINYPKSIVYLSDVSERNGPTSCYPGIYEGIGLNPLRELVGRVVGTVGSSSISPLNGYYAKQYHQSVNSEGFRRHFMRLPQELRFNSHMGWDVFPGSDLENTFVTAENKMIGPSGTFIVFDGGRLFHRGGLIDEGQRVVLQVIFSDKKFTEIAMSKLKRMLS